MIAFDESTHTYTCDGIILPSVTHICRFFNVDLAANAKPWLRDIAADRGRRVHAYTVTADYGDVLENVDPDCMGYLRAYYRFLRDYDPKWERIEYIMGDKTLGFAGTADRMGVIDGKKTILDIKTTGKLHKPIVTAQLQGYSILAAYDRKPFLATKLCALLLDKGGTYRLYDLPYGEEFETCLKMNQLMKGASK